MKSTNQNKQVDYEDPVGASTLEAISDAGEFNQWMYQTIRPYLSGKVLEIGSGIGNISKHVLDDKLSLYLTDLRSEYCEILESEFSTHPGYLGCGSLDLVHPDFDVHYAQLLGRFDTVFALNVVEHIEDDGLAIRNCNKLIRPGGKLVILVPAYMVLYNSMDKGLGHFRRYTKKSLTQLIDQNQLEVVHGQYFNFTGIFAWFIGGRILRGDGISKGPMSLYNRFVPVFKVIDRLVLRSMGLSTIVVGKNSD